GDVDTDTSPRYRGELDVVDLWIRPVDHLFDPLRETVRMDPPVHLALGVLRIHGLAPAHARPGEIPGPEGRVDLPHMALEISPDGRLGPAPVALQLLSAALDHGLPPCVEVVDGPDHLLELGVDLGRFGAYLILDERIRAEPHLRVVGPLGQE